MFQSIKNLFEDLLATEPGDNAQQKKTLELATAVLMIEISLADDHIDEREREAMHSLLSTSFDLEQEQITDLIELAEKESNHAVSLYEFTRLLNDTYDMDKRIEVIKNLWKVAYADSVLDKYEEYYIRKVADLLYVSHSDYIKSKHDAAT